MSRRRKRQPTVEETALWQAVVKDATPLVQDRVAAKADGAETAGEEAASATSTAPESPARRFRATTAITAPPSNPSVPSTLGVGQRATGEPSVRVQRAIPGLRPGDMAGIDRRTADRFRRGRMEIDGRIDLHGMTLEQAHGALTGFLRAGAVQGRRCVLVITGKGTRGEGVIRRSLPHWLGDAMVRPLILAYTPAQPQHGGQGAFYVLLRRRRD